MMTPWPHQIDMANEVAERLSQYSIAYLAAEERTGKTLSIILACEKLELKRIMGRALPENLASISVLEKCGMQYLGEEVIEGLLHKTYEKTALLHL